MQAAHCLFGVGTLAAPLLLQASGLQDHDSAAVPSWGGIMFGNAVLFVAIAMCVVCFPSPRKDELVETEDDNTDHNGANPVQRPWVLIFLAAALLCFEVGGLESGFGGFQYTYAVKHQ